MPFGVGDCVLLVDDEGRPYTDPLYEIMQIDASRQLPYYLEMCGSRHRSTWVDAIHLRDWDGFAIGEEVQLWSNRATKPSWHGAYGKITQIDFSDMTVSRRQFQVETNKAERWWVPQCVLRRMIENGAAAGPAAENRFVLSGPGNSEDRARIDALESEVEAEKAKNRKLKADYEELATLHWDAPDWLVREEKEVDALQSTNRILLAGKRRHKRERDRIVKDTETLIEHFADIEKEREKEREALENAVRVAKRQRTAFAGLCVSSTALNVAAVCVAGVNAYAMQLAAAMPVQVVSTVSTASGVGALFFM